MQSKVLLLLILALGSLTAVAQTTPEPPPPPPVPKMPKSISGGVLNGKAINLPTPPYPPAARAVNARGMVSVQVVIDEEGNVISASAVSGHPLLRAAAQAAAFGAKFSPTQLAGQPVKVTGVITYSFVASISWARAGAIMARTEADEVEDSVLASLAQELPSGFESERDEITNLLGRAAKPESRKERIAALIESFQNKLSGEPTDLWDFDVSLTLRRIEKNLKNDSILQKNLFRLQELVYTVPNGIAESRLNPLKELAEYANRSTFTTEDRKDIERILDAL